MESCLLRLSLIHISFRGLGMSQGILIVKKDSEGCKVPDVDGVFKIIFRAYEKGLILITLGLNVLRIQPPLNIRPEKLHEGFVILDEAITDLEAVSYTHLDVYKRQVLYPSFSWVLFTVCGMFSDSGTQTRNR